MKPKNNKISKIFVDAIQETTLHKLLNQRVLLEMANKHYMGTLGKFKGRYAIYEDNTVKTSFLPEDVIKITVKNQNTNLFESIVKCGNNRYCVKSKKGKNLGGPYTKNKANERLQEIEYFKGKNQHESLLLQDTLKSLFFSEEIVNKDHKGRMTKGMQASRDRIASKLKNVKVVKGPPGRDDTPEEAKYRLATYLEWKKKSGGN